MEISKKTPLNLVFVFGYQKYFLDKTKQNKETDVDKIHLLSSLLEDRKNYIFVINYAYSREEFNNSSEKDVLPPCILEEDESTHIPQELIFRARNLGHMSIFHRKSLNLFKNTNPCLEDVLNNISETLKLNEEYELNLNISRIIIFNLNEDKNDNSIFMISDFLNRHDVYKNIKIEIY